MWFKDVKLLGDFFSFFYSLSVLVSILLFIIIFRHFKATVTIFSLPVALKHRTVGFGKDFTLLLTVLTKLVSSLPCRIPPQVTDIGQEKADLDRKER